MAAVAVVERLVVAGAAAAAVAALLAEMAVMRMPETAVAAAAADRLAVQEQPAIPAQLQVRARPE